ncbi:MAG TPA: hypothetical protein VI759_01590 [Dehalococcoidia bacterium]|nr:hypothetical protein [Dehalococcoidia bacterium]
MFKPRFFVSLALVALVAFGAMRTADSGSAASSQTIQGIFTIINIDPPPVRGPGELYFITPDTGAKMQVIPGGSAFAQHTPAELNRRRVTITGTPGTLNGNNVFLADAIQFAPISANKVGAAPIAAQTGSKPWLVLMCRFSDFSGSSPTQAQVDTLQGDNTSPSVYPSLDHYFRQISYDNINLNGSVARNWLNLTHPKSYYLSSGGEMGGSDWDNLANDCMNLHDSAVNFPSFEVITVLVNSDLGCCGYGGSFNMTRDGVNKTYGFTWVPGIISGQVYLDQSFNGHELGHALGLPHSYGPGSGAPYDSDWDIMSNCSASGQSSYGAPYWCYGPGTIAFHKDLLGWIPGANKLTLAVGTNVVTTVDMYPLGDGIPGSGTYLMAQVNWPATSGSNCQSSADPSKCFLTVEVRRRASNSEENYDQNVPGSGVVLHRVDKNRSFQNGQAKVVDSDGDGDGNDSGAIFTVGETYTDPVTDIEIEVMQALSNGGFRIRFTPPGAPPPPTGSCNGVSATIVGTAAGETINGTSGNDVIAGLGGDDTINGLGGNDLICGGDGADTINGGDGNDTIFGENQNDIINGDANDDFISGGAHDDTINGGPGFDWVSYASASIGVTVNLQAGVASKQGNDTLANIEGVEGSSFDDHLRGGLGNDSFKPRGGNDSMNGGGGLDTVIYSTTVSGVCSAPVSGSVTIDLLAGTISGPQGSGAIAGVENVVGTCGDDTISGSGAPNMLDGASGNDTLDGRTGADTLLGGPANDTLKGGNANDSLDGGPGTDTLIGGAGTDSCTTGETLTSCE